MTDIARDRLPKDLRQAARIMAETGTFQTGQGLLTDAANEIERLRSAIMEAHGALRMAGTITMVCDNCGKRVDTPRCDTDPPDAVEMHGTVCPECDTGGFDMPAYFDRSGAEICGNPNAFKEPENG